MSRPAFTFRIIIVAICLFTAICATSQTQVTGLVRDSLTMQPLEMVSVYLVGTDEGTLSNEQGGFFIASKSSASQLRLSAVGYTTRIVDIKPLQGNVVVVNLAPLEVQVGEVTVTKTKEKYSKRDNPAVELARRLRAARHNHDPERRPFYAYDRYERIAFGLNNFNPEERSAMMKRYPFLAEYTDMVSFTGATVLPVCVKEKYSRLFHRASPDTWREVVDAYESHGVDDMLDKASMKRFLDELFGEVDIFDDDISFMQQRFVSPLSAIAPDFYRFYLNDTIEIDGERCVELSFVPFNNQDFGFLGRLYVPENDTSLFIKKVRLNVPLAINLNYVKQVYIEQDFIKSPDGDRLKTRDDMMVEFALVKGAQELFAQRSSSFASHRFTPPPDLDIFNQGAEQIFSRDAYTRPHDYWQSLRNQGTATSAGDMQQLMSRLRQSKGFYWVEKALTALMTGYVPTKDAGSKFDIGRINTFISGNDLEGLRLKFGGMTTANLNPHLFVSGYVARGFRDHQWKYGARLDYSFNRKEYHAQEFPVHGFSLSHSYDIDQIGQHYLYTSPDNVVLALRRHSNRLIAYLRQTQLEYRLETHSGLSFSLAFQHRRHEDSRLWSFTLGDGTTLPHFSEAGFTATLRYAPHEKFYQMRDCRVPISLDAPIITLTHTYYPRHFMHSRYEVNRTSLSAQKRLWFSAFGYADVFVKGEKLWSTAPYTELPLPNSNLSYTIQPESFALLDPMELLCDQALSWDVTYWANGLIFNRVPLIRKLKLREAFSFRGVWGSLDDKNNPALNPALLQIPESIATRPIGNRPYMEIGVGIDNILTLLRIDYVWRLTYNHPAADHSGIRIQLHATF